MLEMLHGEKGALPPKYHFRGFAVVRNPRLQTLLVNYVHEKDVLTREGAPTIIQSNPTKLNATKKKFPP